MIQVRIGQAVRLVSRMKRTDGLTDLQEVVGRITYVDADRAEYEVTERVREEHVRLRVVRGGFSRRLSPEQLARQGFTLE
jgi:hypothetical protein